MSLFTREYTGRILHARLTEVLIWLENNNYTMGKDYTYTVNLPYVTFSLPKSNELKRKNFERKVTPYYR